MLEATNKNNWHKFLDSVIHGALTDARGDNNLWIKNIFTKLNDCFNDYCHIFDNIACNYYGYYVRGLRKTRYMFFII